MLMIRRIVGDSMVPALPPGKLVLATRHFKRLKPGAVVIIEHRGLEKIKRIVQVKDGQIYVLGDNLLASKDSRHFGWLDTGSVRATVLWPL